MAPINPCAAALSSVALGPLPKEVGEACVSALNLNEAVEDEEPHAKSAKDATFRKVSAGLATHKTVNEELAHQPS